MKTWAIIIVLGLAGAALAAPPTPPYIQAQDAYPINSTSAQVNATVLSDGGSEATLPILYWGRDDGGTNSESWEYSYGFAAPCTSGAPVSLVLTGLESGRNYAYTFAVTNEAGATWASNSIWFDVPLGDWWVQQQLGQFPLMGSTRIYESAGGNNALSNVVLWYSFGQTNNGMYEPIFDQTMNGHSGSNSFPSGYIRDWSGDYAYSVSAADDNRVATSEPGLLNGSSALTVAMWVRVTSYESPQSSAWNLFGWSYGDVNNHFAISRMSVDGTFYVTMRSGGFDANSSYINVGNNLAAWTRIVYVYQKGAGLLDARATLYFNATAVYDNLATRSMFVSISGPWQFGSPQDGEFPFFVTCRSWSGYIDDVVLDDVAWTPAQVAVDYTAGRSRLSEFFDGPSLISGPELPDGVSTISREE